MPYRVSQVIGMKGHRFSLTYPTHPTCTPENPAERLYRPLRVCWRMTPTSRVRSPFAYAPDGAKLTYFARDGAISGRGARCALHNGQSGGPDSKMTYGTMAYSFCESLQPFTLRERFHSESLQGITLKPSRWALPFASRCMTAGCPLPVRRCVDPLAAAVPADRPMDGPIGP